MKSEIEKFTFSAINIEKIRNLNIKLKKEEDRVMVFARQLHDGLIGQKKENRIDDFNIHSSLAVFSSDSSCNKRNHVEKGDPIWEDPFFLLFGESTDDIFYTDNWNEQSVDSSLRNEFFCYSMHCVCFHSHLTWQDIVDIDIVYIELKIDYQFLIEM